MLCIHWYIIENYTSRCHCQNGAKGKICEYDKSSTEYFVKKSSFHRGIQVMYTDK